MTGRPTLSPRGPVTALTVRLTPEAREALARVRKTTGLGPSELYRRLIIAEDLRLHKARRAR